MAQLLILLVLGPAQTLSGKYYRHSDEYLKMYPRPQMPLPRELPRGVDELCALIESGHDTPQLYAVLGEALYRRGDRALAYRAFDKAQRRQHPDRNYIVKRKDACEYVAEKTIRHEEREAEIWVDALRSYERAAIKAGRDPADLDAFHERYGKPDDDLSGIVRARRISFLGGVAGVFSGMAFAFGARRLRKRAAAIPLLVSVACFAGPLILGFAGLLIWGGLCAAAGGLLVSMRGR